MSNQRKLNPGIRPFNAGYEAQALQTAFFDLDDLVMVVLEHPEGRGCDPGRALQDADATGRRWRPPCPSWSNSRASPPRLPDAPSAPP